MRHWCSWLLLICVSLWRYLGSNVGSISLVRVLAIRSRDGDCWQFLYLLFLLGVLAGNRPGMAVHYRLASLIRDLLLLLLLLCHGGIRPVLRLRPTRGGEGRRHGTSLGLERRHDVAQ